SLPPVRLRRHGNSSKPLSLLTAPTLRATGNPAAAYEPILTATIGCCRTGIETVAAAGGGVLFFALCLAWPMTKANRQSATKLEPNRTSFFIFHLSEFDLTAAGKEMWLESVYSEE